MEALGFVTCSDCKCKAISRFDKHSFIQICGYCYDYVCQDCMFSCNKYHQPGMWVMPFKGHKECIKEYHIPICKQHLPLSSSI
jgi:uncharacterized Fe-S center protein